MGSYFAICVSETLMTFEKLMNETAPVLVDVPGQEVGKLNWQCIFAAFDQTLGV